MKLVCDCGNEMEFVINNEGMDECEYGNGHEEYASNDHEKFDLYANNGVLIIECQNEVCKKAIWTFC